jgi:hypothetical protein
LVSIPCLKLRSSFAGCASIHSHPKNGMSRQVRIWWCSTFLFHVSKLRFSFLTGVQSIRILYIKVRWCLSVCPSRCQSWFQDLDERTGSGLEIEVPKWKRRTTRENEQVSVRLSVTTNSAGQGQGKAGQGQGRAGLGEAGQGGQLKVSKKN